MIEGLSALPGTINAPNNNPITNEKIELGRTLFFDPILSGNRDVACATCHHPDFGYADGRDLSSGINGVGGGPARQGGAVIRRNAPTIINTAFNGINENRIYDPVNAPMFWDNRASGLEEQALLPIQDHDEMRGDQIAAEDILNVVIQRLKDITEYRNLFANALGDGRITVQRLGQALATF